MLVRISEGLSPDVSLGIVWLGLALTSAESVTIVAMEVEIDIIYTR